VTLNNLASLDVATVYEASGLECAMDPGLRPAWPGAKLLGKAFPIRCHPGDNLALHRALEHAAPGDVLTVNAGGHLAGYWGEILAVAAQTAGITGLVIDGGVRDVDQLEAMGFPVFSRGVGVTRTTKHDGGLIGQPTVVGGILVSPGDVVLADGDGILVLPPTKVDEIAQRANARRTAEAGYLARIRDGELTLDIYGLRDRL
jgi:4-hydroxy-4-methyl-2-oxoglutarate aldolase